MNTTAASPLFPGDPGDGTGDLDTALGADDVEIVDLRSFADACPPVPVHPAGRRPAA
jgi:hypothetical protein